MANTEIEQLSIDTIRTLAMDAVQQANAGHPGTAMALAPLAYLLYTRGDARTTRRTRTGRTATGSCSAPGHACVLQYAALHLSGYDLSLEELKRSASGSRRRPATPSCGHTAGIEVTTGPLGQGFANGVGMAIAERFLAGDVQPAARTRSSTTAST